MRTAALDMLWPNLKTSRVKRKPMESFSEIKSSLPTVEKEKTASTSGSWTVSQRQDNKDTLSSQSIYSANGLSEAPGIEQGHQ